MAQTVEPSSKPGPVEIGTMKVQILSLQWVGPLQLVSQGGGCDLQYQRP